MVADGVHILVGVALLALLSRTDRVSAYLVVALAAGFPDLDRYLFSPLLYAGYLSGPLWTHRGITHSLAALLLVVVVAWTIGYHRAAAIGYGSHLVADFVTGGIRLLAPLSVQPYGLYYDWMLGNVVAGAAAVFVIAADIHVRRRTDDARFGRRMDDRSPGVRGAAARRLHESATATRDWLRRWLR